MRNLIQDGLVLPLVAPADTLPGDLVVVGAIIGVAVGAAKTGEVIQTRVEGVFDGIGPVGSVGSAVYYDATAGTLTNVKSGNTPVGWSLGDGRVRLTPQV